MDGLPDVNDKRCHQCQHYQNCLKFHFTGPVWKPCSRPLHSFSYSDEIIVDLREQLEAALPAISTLVRIRTVFDRVDEAYLVSGIAAYAFFKAVRNIFKETDNDQHD